MTSKEQLHKIKTLIAKAKLKEAVDLLLSYAESEAPAQVNDMIALSSKFYEVDNKSKNSTIASEDYQRLRSQLILILLEWTTTFETEIRETVKIESLDTIKTRYQLSFARTKVVQVLVDATEGLSIKTIQETAGLNQRKFLITVLEELIAVKLVERHRVDGISLNLLTDLGRRVF